MRDAEMQRKLERKHLSDDVCNYKDGQRIFSVITKTERNESQHREKSVAGEETQTSEENETDFPEKTSELSRKRGK